MGRHERNLDRDIAEVHGTCAHAVCTEGLDSALIERHRRPGQRRKLDGRQEAHLRHRLQRCARRHTHWTLQLLAQGGPDVPESPSRRCATRTPWTKKEWCIPEVSGEFEWRTCWTCTIKTTTPTSGLFRRDVQAIGGRQETVHGARPGRVERYDYAETGPETCSCSVSRKLAGGMSR